MDIIAHRGVSGMAPENTIAAIQMALDLNSDFIEMDMRLSKDNVPVIIHDSNVARVTNPSNTTPIHHLLLKQIKQYDVGSWFNSSFVHEQIPTLDEVLKLNWKKTGLMLEIKTSPKSPKKVIDSLFEVLNRHKDRLPFLIIGSFSSILLGEVKKRMTHESIPIELIGILERKHMLSRFLDLGINRFAIWERIVNKEIMNFLANKKALVWTFTVNDPKKIKPLRNLGVAGIISNVPHLMQKNI